MAVLGVDVLASARNLAAYHHASMAILHLAVADDDVAAGLVPKAAVVVASALDGDAVVTRVEHAVLYQHVLASLGVASVAVGSLVPDVHAVHGDVFREQGMDDPEGGVVEFHVLDEYAVAIEKVDELGAQALSLAKLALVPFHAVLGVAQEACPAAQVLGFLGLAFHVAEAILAAHLPPGVVAAAAIDGSLARDGDVGGSIGVDAGLVVPAADALPGGLHQRIEVSVEHELQRGPFLHHQVYLASQRDGSRFPCARGNDHLSPALAGGGADGLVDGFLVLRGGGRGLGAIVRDGIPLGADLWLLYAGLDSLVLVVVPSRCQGAYGQQHGEQQCLQFSHFVGDRFSLFNL